jgi:CRISPR-associated protein Cas5d
MSLLAGEPDYPPLAVRVWGDWACFTRPELKVERVSYPVMTPSAARGVLEAIFWKPQFSWQVREIWVLNPIRHFSIVRNEVGQRATPTGDGFFADDPSVRTQRHTLALRDVAYLIRAEVAVRAGVDEDPAKFRDQFRRRLARGQCYHRPYLGCREFAADFAAPTGDECPIPLTEELGRFLFDLEFAEEERNTPRFFTARLDRGVLHVPAGLYQNGGAA